MNVSAPGDRGPVIKKGLPWTFILLALILLFGLALRLHRVAAESVDYEEYVNIGPLDAPNLLAYLHQVRANDPSTAPLPFASVYFWVKLVGKTAARARCLFVIIGSLSILLLYLTGYELFGRGAFARRVGLVAALCLAVSPVHVYFSQELRFYAPLTFLALGSYYCLFRALNENRKLWWRLNILLNMLIPWTHLMGWAVLFSQGVCLLILRPREIRRIFKWGLIQCISLVPFALWLMTIQVQSFKTHYAFIGLANLLNVVLDFFGDDVVTAGAGFEPVGNTWWFLPAKFAAPIVSVHVIFDCVLAFAEAAVFIWFVVQFVVNARSRNPRNLTTTSGVVLLVWFIVPVAALHILSRLWIPCAFSRYSIYHSLALYIMIGYTAATFRPAFLRGLGAVAVALLLLYQGSLVLPGPMRTDWKGAGRMIKAQGSPDDVILTYGALYLPILLYNMGPVPYPSAAGQSYEGMADMIDYAFQEFANSPNPRDHHRTIWSYVLKENDITVFERGLLRHGLTADTADFGGGRKMRLYHIRKSSPVSPKPGLSLTSNPALTMDAFTRAFAAQVLSPKVKAFRVAISWDSDNTGAFYARFAMSLAEKDAPELASAFFRKAVMTNPAWAVQFSNLLVRAIVGDNSASAPAALEPATRTSPNDAQAWANYANAFLMDGKFNPALDAFDKAIALDCRNVLPYLGKWRAQIGRQDEAAAAKALRAAMDLDADLATTLRPLYAALYETHNRQQTKERYEAFRAAGIPIAPELDSLF